MIDLAYDTVLHNGEGKPERNLMKIFGIIMLAIFYTVYIGKMILQKRKGIQTDQIAKNKQKDRVFVTELIMKIATYMVVVIEVLSIFIIQPKLPNIFVVSGVIIGFLGDMIFALAVITMKDSWRAGIAENDKTEMITNGIYKISRNPAFLGFDCVYIGLALMFFNFPLLISSILAIIMLHLQILQEETYLQKAFGNNYLSYKNKVCRYLGRKR